MFASSATSERNKITVVEQALTRDLSIGLSHTYLKCTLLIILED
jgi:hypothetical protein